MADLSDNQESRLAKLLRSGPVLWRHGLDVGHAGLTFIGTGVVLASPILMIVQTHSIFGTISTIILGAIWFDIVLNALPDRGVCSQWANQWCKIASFVFVIPCATAILIVVWPLMLFNSWCRYCELPRFLDRESLANEMTHLEKYSRRGLLEKSSAISMSSIRFFETRADDELALGNRSMVFVMAFWSDVSVASFQRWTKLLSTMDISDWDLVVIDVDGWLEIYEHLGFEYAGGAGELALIKQASVGHRLSLNQVSDTELREMIENLTTPD